MDVKNREECPICKLKTGIPHCRSRYCPWFKCVKCFKVTLVIFDKKGRFYTKEEIE